MPSNHLILSEHRGTLIFFNIVLFGCMPRVGLLDLFLIFMEPHTVFHGDWTDLHSHQQYRRVSSSPHPLQHCSQCEVIPHYSFIFISLIIHVNEHLFMCLLAICMNFLRNVYLVLLPTFFYWVVYFLLLSCMNLEKKYWLKVIIFLRKNSLKHILEHLPSIHTWLRQHDQKQSFQS